MKQIAIITTLLMALFMGSCDSVDCSLNNTVFCYVAFYDGEGDPVAINDTLSVYANGTEKVLYNRGVKKSVIAIPMSYYNEEDTLLFRVWSKSESDALEAEVVIGKTNTEHFESPDCPVNMFHDITSSYVFSGRFIDSVVVVKPSVNFQRDENIRVYLH